MTSAFRPGSGYRPRYAARAVPAPSAADLAWVCAWSAAVVAGVGFILGFAWAGL